MVVVADLELGEEHNLVMDKFFQYLRSLQTSMREPKISIKFESI